MNNNNGGETPGNDNVLDLASIRDRLREVKPQKGGGDPPKEPPVRSGNWELHMHPLKEGEPDILLRETGFLKFGPQFIAIVEGHEDASQVRMVVATHLVRYVKMISDDATHVQGTLSL